MATEKDVDALLQEQVQLTKDTEDENTKMLSQIDSLNVEINDLRTRNGVLTNAILQLSSEFETRARDIAMNDFVRPKEREKALKNVEISNLDSKINELEQDLMFLKEVSISSRSIKGLEVALHVDGKNGGIKFCKEWKNELERESIALADKYKSKAISAQTYNFRRIDLSQRTNELNECIIMVNKQFT